MRAPLREAADSMAKARTPEPFSTSRTSNWVARAGGLPPYIQHIAHDLMEKRGKSESEAIGMAVGIVRNWASGKGKVDANTRAAAALALRQWEQKRAQAHAKVRESFDPSAVRVLEAVAAARLGVVVEQLTPAGVQRMLDGSLLLEHDEDSEAAVALEQLARMVEFDLVTVGGRLPVPLAERFNARELRDFRGRWRGGDGHSYLTPPRESGGGSRVPTVPFARTVAPRPSVPRRPSAAAMRYEGGVPHEAARSRRELAARAPLRVDDNKLLQAAIPAGAHTPGALRAAQEILNGAHPDTQHAHALRDANGEMVRNAEGGVVYTAERARLHEQIIERLLAGKQSHTGRFGPRALFTAGGPASGKGGLLKKGLVRVDGAQRVDPHLGEDDMVHVNPDIIRMMLPEYRSFQQAGHEEAAAGLTHEEASDLSKSLQRIAMQRQHHILVDGVGDSESGKFAGKIRKAQEAGYRDVSVHYATAPIDEAIARADKRGRETGRYVEHTTIIRNHIGVSQRYPEVAAMRGVHVRVFDTSGEGPDKLIAEKLAQQERTAILDSGAMGGFNGKANLSVAGELKRRKEG